MIFFTLYFFNKKLKYSPRSSKFLKLSKEAAEGLNKTVLLNFLLELITSIKTCLNACSKLLKHL